MEIFGYSERGAMNALFYGIALNKDEKALNEFLHMAGETETFQDFKLYSEFSLSDFGSPDFVITAENPADGKKIVFFIEAKASARGYYDLGKQEEHHKAYIDGNKKFEKGHSSNLFFQLKEKFLLLNSGSNKTIIDRTRKLGENEIVKKFYKDIKDAQDSRYIAIIPEQKDDCAIIQKKGHEKIVPVGFSNDGVSFHFDIHLLYWEDIAKEPSLGNYVSSTLTYNKDEDEKSQILNNQKRKL